LTCRARTRTSLMPPASRRSSEGGFAPLPNLPPKQVAPVKPALGTEHQLLAADLEGHSSLRQTPRLLSRLVGSRGRRSTAHRLDAERRSHLGLEVGQHLGVVSQIALGVLTSLPDALVPVRVPGPRLLHDVVLGSSVENRAL